MSADPFIQIPVIFRASEVRSLETLARVLADTYGHSQILPDPGRLASLLTRIALDDPLIAERLRERLEVAA